MIQKIVSICIVIIGLFLFVFPFTSGDNAYFIKDTYFLNITDSVDKGYEPYLKMLVQKERSELAFVEKKQLYKDSKKKGDELDRSAMIAMEKKDAMLSEKVNIGKNELTMFLMEKEAEIDNKYNVDNLPVAEFTKLFDAVKAKVSQEQYLVAVANEVINPTQNEKIKPIFFKDISIQKVNLQNKSAFILSGLLLMGIGFYLLLFEIGIIKLENRVVKNTSILVFLFLCFLMSAKTYYSIDNRIEFDKTLAIREKAVKEKLMDIRALELTYFEKKKKYCNNFEDLINFALNDSVKIVKYLVNKDDTAAVNLALKKGLKLEDEVYVKALEKALNNKKINIKDLAIVPYTKESFQINAGIIDKNGRDVHVFEVKTSKFLFVKELSTLPENFDKSKSLVLGSMAEPTTEGNW